MQHNKTERITDTILFQHRLPLPAVSATDHLLTAIKQLQDTITQHAVPLATTEEKAIKYLCDLLTSPSQHKTLVNKSMLPETMNHPLNITTAPNIPNMAPTVSHKQNNLPHPHITIQDNTAFDDKPPIKHQYNLCLQAQLIAKSIV